MIPEGANLQTRAGGNLSGFCGEWNWKASRCLLEACVARESDDCVDGLEHCFQCILYLMAAVGFAVEGIQARLFQNKSRAGGDIQRLFAVFRRLAPSILLFIFVRYYSKNRQIIAKISSMDLPCWPLAAYPEWAGCL